MRRSILLLSIILSIIGVGIFFSCSSEERVIDLISEQGEIDVLYRKASVRAKEFNYKSMQIVTGGPTRVEETEDILGYLLDQTPEEVDNLYEKLYNKSEQEERERMASLKLDSLIQITSIGEVSKLKTFINNYISNGGHSEDLLCIELKPIESDIVRQVAINAAATYDHITSIETAAFLSNNTRAHRICQMYLALDTGGIIMSVTSTAMQFSAGDILWGVVDCAHDVVQIISAVRRYNTCERMENLRDQL